MGVVTSKLTPCTWLRATLLRRRASCVRTCPSGVAPRDWNAVFIPRGGVLLLALAISSLLLVDAVVASAPLGGPGLDLDEEDLSFLEEEVGVAVSHEDKGSADNADDSYSGSDESEYDDQDQYEAFDDLGHGSHNTVPTIDETDVVVLTDGNFSDFLEKHRHMMVEFYAPEDYPGQRSRDAIVTWIKKKIGPGVENITTVDEAEKILTSESKVVLGFLDSLVGDESQELSAASKLEDGVNFYQTVNPDVAKLFHIDPSAKRPSVVLLMKDAEKISYFHGQFSKSAIVDFVFANKLPLVTTFTRESAPEIFENPIKKTALALCCLK
ncbi:hypothetical protein OPV22_002605 [Ensete ventricosum]|uniref:protein disulfide-isomerase n=1 Tax=Ensete ventricosum TaxID=4639 RepID=A0AAV8RYH0_ENSVE|nr:hypothetical protein OPV22_002605 [Ensete ventricosum]